MRPHTVWTLLAVASTILAACGSGAVQGSTTTSVAASTTIRPTTTTTTTATTSTEAATTSTTVPVITTTSPGGEGRLPGEPIEFGPGAGDTLAVVGVAHDDVLNLRAAPGADQEILSGIPPLADSLTARGETRQLASGALWVEVGYAGTDGWVNLRYLAYLGETHDVTATIVEQIGGTPSGESMLELGKLVAESVAGDPSADIVISVAPTVGDLGEVTFDITGFEDDSVRGGRYHVFGQASEDGFTLEAVEATTFCARGVDDGVCV